MIPITDEEFRNLAALLRASYGIHLKREKKTLVHSRLHPLLIRHNFASFSDYYRYVLADRTGEAAAALADRMTTNYTYFLREPDHFRCFRDQVLPYLKQAAAADRDMRIWSAACSTGEEPYTLAMLLDDALGAERPMWDARVLATDLSREALDEARRGLYENERLEGLPADWRSRYSRPQGGSHARLSERIRSQVIFRRLNLMEDFPPFRKKFHAIFCRNVMIYFDAETRRQLIDRFYRVTEPGGWLFIGQSESLNRDETAFQRVMPSVFRKL